MAYKKSGVCFCRNCAVTGTPFRRHQKVNERRLRRIQDKVIIRQEQETL